MHALFIGGTIDNAELDLEGDTPPTHYPPQTGAGVSRYRLHQVGRRDGSVVYAVYGAPDLAIGEVERVAQERDYARRFEANVERVAG